MYNTKKRYSVIIRAIIESTQTKMVKPRVDLVTIDAARINDVCRLYFLWKDLNLGLKNFVSRGINFPEAISEPMACYALGYRWNKGTAGDAVSNTGEHIEMKATSNFDSDLTSFGPTTVFDKLYFLRLKQTTNELYIYDMGLNSQTLGQVQANLTETVADQQAQGRRPRLRIIETIIEPEGMLPEVIFDIRTMQVINP